MYNNTNQISSNKNIKPVEEDEEKPKIELLTPTKESMKSNKNDNFSSRQSKI